MMAKLTGIALAGTMMIGCCGAAFAQSNDDQLGPNWNAPDIQGMRATHALNMLEAQGYGQFSHFRQAGNDFTADVRKNGRTMQVLINPDSSQIVPESNVAGNM
jgi:hypothetical protein